MFHALRVQLTSRFLDTTIPKRYPCQGLGMSKAEKIPSLYACVKAGYAASCGVIGGIDKADSICRYLPFLRVC